MQLKCKSTAYYAESQKDRLNRKQLRHNIVYTPFCKQKLTMQENGKQECKKTENKNAPFSSLNIQIFKELNRR